jgi:hypothetical protein
LRLAYLGLGGLIVLAAAACGAEGPQSHPDASDADVKNNGPDGGEGPPEAGFNAVVPSLVFIDGLVSGFATNTFGQPLQLADVRVCVFDVGKNAYITQHAAPYSTPMPLTNYPGIRQGSGVDLGAASSQVRIDVFSADDLSGDAAWSPDTQLVCQQIACNKQGVPCKAHVSFPVTLGGDVNVVALVDDNTDGGVGVNVATASFEYKNYAGDPGSLWGTVIDFSTWHASETIGAFYGDWQTGAGDDVQIANPLFKNKGLPPQQITGAIASYETQGIRFDQFSGQQPFDRFGQSLDSIAYVANAAVSPTVFYDVRQNFVFALIGDPNDPTSVLANGGRDPQFERTGLHIAAIPYAQPKPL